jgi:hypothetical protein
MLSEWNKFVSKVYQEGKKSNANYQFKDALKDASSRKGEMKSSGTASKMGVAPMKMQSRRSRKSSRRSCMKKCKKMCKTQKMRGGKRGKGKRGGNNASNHLMPAKFPSDSNSP